MSVIWSEAAAYHSVPYDNEQDLEDAIVQIAPALFGADRVFLSVKRKVGKNIPDGYLIDFSGPQATLF
ncbi:MAG: hypothetical protein ABSH03_16645, partial [Candidatus Lustribacter sp.]